MSRSVWENGRRAAGVLAMGAVVVAAAGCGTGQRGSFKVAGANAPATVAAFDRIKALAGTWEFTDQDHPGTTTFAVSSNGSVVREIMLPGTDHEVTNLYHMDGPDLVVTHYCAIGNQPRMRARPSDVSADRIAFGPDGVTNLRSADEMYMGQLTLVFTGRDTLRQEWRTFQQGKLNEDHAVFEMRRRPQARGGGPEAPAAALLAAAIAQSADTGGVPAAAPDRQAAEKERLDRQNEAMAAMNPLTPEHKMLAEGCGTYDLKLTIAPMGGGEPIVINAVVTREMILGGKFRLERTESTGDSAMPYSAISIVGFNRDAEAGPRFEITRYSSTVSCVLPETGAYDAATRTITSTGEHDVNGMRGKMRVIHTLLDGGREKAEVYLAMEGYAEAFKGMKVPEYKAMTLEFTKRD